jgi:protein kinase-like protein
MISYDGLGEGFTVAGRYVIEARLGNGHFAAVYKALDRTTSTHVALKVLNPQFADDPITTERFVREVAILRSVHHPNVIKVYDVFRAEGSSIICMEWFDGSDCRTYLDRVGPLPVAEFLAIAKIIVSAVSACHRLKIVHRDLKPQNVLINARREIKLVDFGMSKMQASSDLTRTGTIIGTPQYLAPEMFRSTRADPRSDIYALGAVFHELLTDRPPYRAQTLAEIMTLQLREDVDALTGSRPDIPPWLDTTVRKCLRTDPASRYQSCYELLRDLERGVGAARPRADLLPCAHCQSALLPGLPFCHQCGQFREVVFERGHTSVLLQRCDQPGALQTSLQRTFPGARTNIAARVSRLPAVLLRGVSATTARTTVQQLAAVPCELRVTDRLATAVEIPMLHAGLALAVVVTLCCVAASLSPMGRVAMIIGAELTVLGLYWLRTQPLITPESLRRAHAPAAIDPVLLGMVHDLKRLNDAGLKAILGTVLRSFLTLRDRLRSSTSALDVATITRAVTAALRAAREVEAQEVYLASANASELHARLRSVEARLGDVHTTDESAALIATKTSVERDLKNFYEIQDAHATTYVALVNLQGVLQRIEDGLGTSAGATDAVDDLRNLQEDLVPRRLHV